MPIIAISLGICTAICVVVVILSIPHFSRSNIHSSRTNWQSLQFSIFRDLLLVIFSISNPDSNPELSDRIRFMSRLKITQQRGLGWIFVRMPLYGYLTWPLYNDQEFSRVSRGFHDCSWTFPEPTSSWIHRKNTRPLLRQSRRSQEGSRWKNRREVEKRTFNVV